MFLLSPLDPSKVIIPKGYMGHFRYPQDVPHI